MTTMIDTNAVPRSGVERALVLDAAELRSDDGGTGRTLVGHFAVFDEMTEIRSLWEGEFREKISPGAFRRTIRDRRGQIRCIYAHGRDSMFGSKPIGNPRVIEEDKIGARYEVDLYENADIDGWLIPAARDGQLGASFAFDVVSEEWELEPDDGGLPIRTISELRLYEFGPCPFPAYADATAGVRSVLASFDELPDYRRQAIATSSTLGDPNLFRFTTGTNTSSTSGSYSFTSTLTPSAGTGDGPEDEDPSSSDSRELIDYQNRDRELRLSNIRKESR